MKESVTSYIKETPISPFFYLTQAYDPKKGQHNLPGIGVVSQKSWVLHFRLESNLFGTEVALLPGKRELADSKGERKKKKRPLNRTTMLFEHQRIITKQRCDELNVNESGTCGFNFLPNTHICRFKGKCPITHMLSCSPLTDGKSITEPTWALTLPPRLDLFLSVGI